MKKKQPFVKTNPEQAILEASQVLLLIMSAAGFSLSPL